MCTHLYSTCVPRSDCFTGNKCNCVSYSQSTIRYSCLHTQFPFQISYIYSEKKPSHISLLINHMQYKIIVQYIKTDLLYKIQHLLP